MKLYEVNQAIESVIDQMVDIETGEILPVSDELMEQLNSLEMERDRILGYLAKLVLNTRAEAAALKEEETRLKNRRDRLEKKENRLMEILDRECGGEKTNLGVATLSYRKEWCDMLLFCNYRTFVVQSDNAMEKAKATGGKRVIYTAHHPCWDAKNRHGLPEMMDLDYKSIAHLFTDAATAKKPESADAPAPAKSEAPEQAKPIELLRQMMADANVTDAEIQKVVSSKGHYTADVPISDYTEKFLNGWLIKYWPQVLKLIEADRTGLN
ncbi:MAG: siphovirus Gp157 family protein [Clostridiales bacterium]|nr:siphovirus Gp157 family protein [Clostridiales bacterium]